VKKLNFDQEIEKQLNEATEERPACLRSNIVEKYVLDILSQKSDPALYQQKCKIVKDLIKIGKIDNRVFNQMRQSMNEQIEDERGLMSKDDFKKMLFTAFGRITTEKKELIFGMIVPIISTPCNTNVSIDKLS